MQNVPRQKKAINWWNDEMDETGRARIFFAAAYNITLSWKEGKGTRAASKAYLSSKFFINIDVYEPENVIFIIFFKLYYSHDIERGVFFIVSSILVATSFYLSFKGKQLFNL